MHYILQPGFKSTNGQIEILDSDSLCYIVKNNSKGATGVRTISRSLLNEYVDYFEKYPSNTAAQAREDLAGRTNIDKFEYGYTSTLTTMAKMVTGELLCSSDKAIAAASFNPVKRIDEPLQIIYYGAPGTGRRNMTQLFHLKHYIILNTLKSKKYMINFSIQLNAEGTILNVIISPVA